MKIAVASEGALTAGHFGHCANFNLYDVENGVIVKEESVPNPGHKPGFLPNFLADLGATAIISGGMGGAAVQIFNDRGVEVVIGIAGEAKTNAQAYIAGELVSTGSICHNHEHAHECGEH